MSRVLVIDDSPMLVELTVRALSAAGYHATGATDLASLEVKLAEGPFALILMDVNMPEMFGDDVVEYLRTQKKVTAKLVLYSDIAEEELAAKTRQSGADAYILKGGGLEAVIGGIMRILGAPPPASGPRPGMAPPRAAPAPAGVRPPPGAPVARPPAPAVARPLGQPGVAPGAVAGPPRAAMAPPGQAPGVRPPLAGAPMAPRPGMPPPQAGAPAAPRAPLPGQPPAARPGAPAPGAPLAAPRPPGAGPMAPPRPPGAVAAANPALTPRAPGPVAAPPGQPMRPMAPGAAPAPGAPLTRPPGVPGPAPVRAPPPPAAAPALSPAPVAQHAPPVAPPPATPPSAPTAPAVSGGFPSAAKMTAAGGRKPRILIVDDSEMTARIIEADLVSKGFEVHIADSADKATKIILKKQTRPDLVLLDVRMPNVNGEQFCRFIKSNSLFKGIKVLLCSGENVEELQRICREAGADGYVPKDAVLGNLVAKELNPTATSAE